MEESRPAAAEPEQTAAQEGKPPRTRRRLHVPTSVLVTILVAAFSVWVAPAFTRQWEDRQKVRELRAAFAEEIATATAAALSGGREAARRSTEIEGQGGRRALLGPVRLSWDVSLLRIEMKLRAYYPPAVADQWSEFATDVRQFLQICLLTGPATTEDEGIFLRGEIARTLPRIVEGRELLRDYFQSAEQPVPRITQSQADRALAAELTDPSWSMRQSGLELLRAMLLSKAQAATTALFSAKPGDFSTTRSDLLRDLLP